MSRKTTRTPKWGTSSPEALVAHVNQPPKLPYQRAGSLPFRFGLGSVPPGGRADHLRRELEALFESQNTSQGKDVTSIPATFLRATVAVN
jgi:hypothetical protein